MDFSLAFAQPLMGLAPAEQKNRILATNQESARRYGLRLTADEGEMLLATAENAVRQEELVQLGDSIVPRLIHWFLPSGYFGMQYALQVAELTECFYRVKGILQQCADEAGTHVNMLSDNAILDHMYRLYITPEAEGNTDVVMELMEDIVCPAAEQFIRSGKAPQTGFSAHSGVDPETAALYADRMQAEDVLAGYRPYSEREEDDVLYRETMHDGFVDNLKMNYHSEAWRTTRFDYISKLSALLEEHPHLVKPSPEFEDEMEEMVTGWLLEDKQAAERKES